MAGLVQDPEYLFAFNIAERPWLRCRHPVGFRRLGTLAMPPVMGRTWTAQRGTRRGDTHHRSQLEDGVVDHRFGSPLVFGSALLVASSSNSAESFPCTSITRRAVPNSSSSRPTRWRSRALSRSTGSTGALPGFAANASSAPRSRCLRHSETSDEYRPSRRNNEPLASRSEPSYSARISNLYLAVYDRRFARSGTSGSGSFTRPAWLANRSSAVIDIQGFSHPRPLNTVIHLHDLSHERLTQRAFPSHPLTRVSATLSPECQQPSHQSVRDPPIRRFGGPRLESTIRCRRRLRISR